MLVSRLEATTVRRSIQDCHLSRKLSESRKTLKVLWSTRSDLKMWAPARWAYVSITWALVTSWYRVRCTAASVTARQCRMVRFVYAFSSPLVTNSASAGCWPQQVWR